jgi:hypothetical protein
MIDRTNKNDGTHHHTNDGSAHHHRLHEDSHAPHPHAGHSPHNQHQPHEGNHKNDGGNSSHHKVVDDTVHKIEKILHHNPHDFSHVFKEIDHLRHQDPKHFNADLHSVNKQLHADKYLPKLEIIQDDHVGKHSKVEHGYDIVAKDPSLKHQPGNHTIVSTSHHAPKESKELQHAYHSMHYGHGHYNGFKQSVEGGHGAAGGFDGKAVGGHVPEGARKELIDQALKLAGVPVSAATEAAVNKIVTRESAWNPNITNNWDSNAKAGHPSTGLMQTIPGTFKQYALKGYDQNIHDPLSNLVAGIRYAQNDPKYRNKGGLLFVASRPGGY